MTRIDKMRKIVTEHSARKIDGYFVDAFSASAFVKVYDALTSDAAKTKMLSAPLPNVMDVVWKCIA